MISDMLILFNKFAPNSKFLPVQINDFEFCIMTTYYLAQFCLSESAVLYCERENSVKIMVKKES